MSIAIPADALVLVADGRKALILANVGTRANPSLVVRETMNAPPNPRTSEQGTDRPGRVMHGARRGKVAQTDWHRQNEDIFARSIADRLLLSAASTKVILIAPPGFLAELRKHLPVQIKKHVIGELAKDLAHLTVGEIEQHLLAHT